MLTADDDVYTNHIHADDLAAMTLGALFRGLANRIYNACDDSELKMADYFNLVADQMNLPRPPRVSRAEAQTQLPKELLSFMGESRRLRNDRMKKELKIKLLFPTVCEGVRDALRRR